MHHLVLHDAHELRQVLAGPHPQLLKRSFALLDGGHGALEVLVGCCDGGVTAARRGVKAADRAARRSGGARGAARGTDMLASVAEVKPVTRDGWPCSSSRFLRSTSSPAERA